MKERADVSIVVPTLNGGRYLYRLLKTVFSQRYNGDIEVVIIDSGSTDRTLEIAREFPDTRVYPIDNFSHGRARNLGVSYAQNDCLVFMAQDALPANDMWLTNLVKELDTEEIGAAFSRQVPYADATPMETFFIRRHFPRWRMVRQSPRGGNCPLSAIFFSNVSAITTRSIIEKFPFDEEIIMSEDQLFAKNVLEAGYRTVYTPESVVHHSHRYSLRTVFRRYFDSLYSLRDITGQNLLDVFLQGKGYVTDEAIHIITKRPLWIPYYLGYTLLKVAGTISGHFGKYLPRCVARCLSMHKYHWNQR